MTRLYRSTDCLSRRGAPVKNLAHNASLDSCVEIAPSKSGIKHPATRSTPQGGLGRKDTALDSVPTDHDKKPRRFSPIGVLNKSLMSLRQFCCGDTQPPLPNTGRLSFVSAPTRDRFRRPSMTLLPSPIAAHCQCLTGNSWGKPSEPIGGKWHADSQSDSQQRSHVRIVSGEYVAASQRRALRTSSVRLGSNVFRRRCLSATSSARCVTTMPNRTGSERRSDRQRKEAALRSG